MGEENIFYAFIRILDFCLSVMGSFESFVKEINLILPMCWKAFSDSYMENSSLNEGYNNGTVETCLKEVLAELNDR